MDWVGNVLLATLCAGGGRANAPSVCARYLASGGRLLAGGTERYRQRAPGGVPHKTSPLYTSDLT